MSEKAKKSTEEEENFSENKNAGTPVLPGHAVFYFLKGRYYGIEKIRVEELRSLLKEVFPKYTEEELEEATMVFAIKEGYVEGWYPYYGTIFPESKRALIKAAIFDKHFLMKR